MLLALIGVATGLDRTTLALIGLDGSPSGIARAQAADSAFYRAALWTSAKPLPGSARELRLRSTFNLMQDKFGAHPAATLLHVVPGTLFMILAPLQLLRGIRGRYPAAHRWSGRMLLLLGMIIGASALFLGWRAPVGGMGETIIITIVGGFFCYASLRAWWAIRHGDVAAHREWMMRFLATGLGISTVRLVASPLSLSETLDVRTIFVVSLLVGWSITLAAAEMVVRASRRAPAYPRPSGSP